MDARLSAFVSFSRGEPQPPTTALWQGFDDKPDSKGNITATRIRSGFMSNVLGWTLHKDVGDHKLTGRFAIWGNMSQRRDKTLSPDLDMREVYVKVDGPWGSVLAGRDLGLFGRGGLLLDYDIEHAYGLGSPCMIVNREPSQGPIAGCGHVGFGILFPAFNAQLSYYTPVLKGFQLAVGIFDPATVQERSYLRTPLPRAEAELSFKADKVFHAEVSGSWQRIGNSEDVHLNVDSLGAAGSLGVRVGPVQVGGAGFMGQGLGIWAALENYPVFSDESPTYVLRHQSGVLGMAALNFGQTKIAGGVGETFVSKTANDPTGPFTALNFPRRQFGISAGIYQGVLEHLVLAFDYFRAQNVYNEAVDPNGAVFTPEQTVHFFNAGVTFVL